MDRCLAPDRRDSEKRFRPVAGMKRGQDVSSWHTSTGTTPEVPSRITETMH